ncbi:MAG: SHOCT domain-containing protein [bacterium]
MFGGMIIIWIFIVVGVIWLIRYLTEQKNMKNNEMEKETSALDILKIQYAKGEINREEFKKRKKDLEN